MAQKLWLLYTQSPVWRGGKGLNLGRLGCNSSSLNLKIQGAELCSLILSLSACEGKSGPNLQTSGPASCRCFPFFLVLYSLWEHSYYQSLSWEHSDYGTSFQNCSGRVWLPKKVIEGHSHGQSFPSENSELEKFKQVCIRVHAYPCNISYMLWNLPF